MPLTRLAADALGVLTICLVALFTLLSLLCIAYSFHFRSRTRSSNNNNNQNPAQLSYFGGPWIIRIVFVLFSIWWGLGEITRLTWLRRENRFLGNSLKWQETACKCYIVSSLGFAEPCLFLTLVLLLRAPLQSVDSGGVLSPTWNGKTAARVVLYSLPLFALQLCLVTIVGPRLSNNHGSRVRIPLSFTSTAVKIDGVALCTYPLMSTILHGIFATLLTAYLFWLGRRILKVVINKGLQRRVYTLIISVSGFFPLRVVLLGFSIFSKPDNFRFEALSFSAFFSLLCCAVACICMLVYFPIADSLALGGGRSSGDTEAAGEQNETVSLIGNHSRRHLDEASGGGAGAAASSGRNSSEEKRGSISFRTYEREIGGCSRSGNSNNFVELSLFSPMSRDGTPPGSPPLLLGWPMNPATAPQQYREM